MEPCDEKSKSERLAGEERRLVTILGPRSVGCVGLARILTGEARVSFEEETHGGETPSFVIICAESAESLPKSVERAGEINPQAHVLVFGPMEDLPLAHAALLAGTRGYVHAMMTAEQVLRALEVAAAGEIVAPRKLLEYLLSGKKRVDLGALSGRQREILALLADGLSNFEIARKLFLSESTIKQHLRAAYKVLGVHNRIEAVTLFRDGG